MTNTYMNTLKESVNIKNQQYYFESQTSIGEVNYNDHNLNECKNFESE